MTTPRRRFHPRFVWGVATAAAQIEGAARAAGKGESIWDRFAQRPGAMANGNTPEPACDHDRRFRSDIALMRSFGIRNHRLSLALPRIFPDGDGAVNRKGLDFHHRLFDSLGENGITPWVTLYHWDLPQALEDTGGWRSRTIVNAFARYAGAVVKEYRGKVRHWITLNEVNCFTKLACGIVHVDYKTQRLTPKLSAHWHSRVIKETSLA